jgi:CelD/BcsL family acetyltransferase involved in cellulose biosynthesis
VSIALEPLADAAGLRRIVAEWDALAAEAAEPNPYYESWMMLPALEAYGTPAGFRCVAVRVDGRLDALFPLVLEPRWRRLPVRCAVSWRHRNMLVGTPLVRAKSAAACITALFESGLAPIVEFDWSASAGPFYGALAEAAREAGLPWMVADAYTRAVLVRGRDPRARFNSNMKNNVRRWQARLAAQGELRPVRLSPQDDPQRWLEEFLRLESSGWKGAAGSALACREDDARFAREVFQEGFRRGRVLLTGLDLRGRPLARHWMLTGGEGAFTFKIAYDEAYASSSPGILAEVDNVRQFVENEGPRWVDSNTARENTSYGRVWKDRRTVQRVAVGLRGAGRLAVAALPLVRELQRLVPRRAKAKKLARPRLAGSAA